MPPAACARPRRGAARAEAREAAGSPAQVGPGSQHAEARAWRVDQGTVEAGQLGWQLTAVRVDDGHVRGAEPRDVLLELTCPGLVHLDGDDVAREHRRLSARRSAEIEHSLARLRADAEPGQLRAAALRPDPTLGERLLVDAVDRIGVRNVRFGPVRGLSPGRVGRRWVAARSGRASARARLPRRDRGATRPRPSPGTSA